MIEVGFRDDPNLEMFGTVVAALGDLCDSLVFVGGCANGLLLTEPRAELIRATQDVDVVSQVATAIQYHELERMVAARGFTHDTSPDAPICRWLRDGIKLDLMSTQKDILGFSNRWYPLAVETAVQVKIPTGLKLNLITAPVFVATKLEAFLDRGKQDYLASHDLEDILTVINGRPELLEEVRTVNNELREYLAGQIAELLAAQEFMQALPGHLPPDSASQQRLPELMRRLRQLTRIES